jgi:hypothetical protein
MPKQHEEWNTHSRYGGLNRDTLRLDNGGAFRLGLLLLWRFARATPWTIRHLRLYRIHSK